MKNISHVFVGLIAMMSMTSVSLASVQGSSGSSQAADAWATDAFFVASNIDGFRLVACKKAETPARCRVLRHMSGQEFQRFGESLNQGVFGTSIETLMAIGSAGAAGTVTAVTVCPVIIGGGATAGGTVGVIAGGGVASVPFGIVGAAGGAVLGVAGCGVVTVAAGVGTFAAAMGAFNWAATLTSPMVLPVQAESLQLTRNQVLKLKDAQTTYATRNYVREFMAFK